MAKRNILLLALIVLASTAALLSGAAFLEAPLFGGLPAGNIIAAAALCAPAAVAIGLGRLGTALRYFSVASFVAAAAWLPVSIGLAGNLSLDFSGLRGQVWIWLSLATLTAVLLSVIGTTIDGLIRLRKSQTQRSL